MRRVALLGLLVIALAGCGGGLKSLLNAQSRHEPSRPPAPRLSHPRRVSSPSRFAVVVVNAVTQRPVRGAVVHLGSQVARTGSDGSVVVPRPGRARAALRVQAHGFSSVVRRVRLHTLRPYRLVNLWPADSGWTMYGASPARTQNPGGIGLRPPLRQVYAVRMDDLVELPPITHAGTAWVTSARGTLVAFDTLDGGVLWRRHLHETMASSPAWVDGTLVVTSLGGLLRGFDPATGRLRWHRALGAPSETSPLVLPGGRVAVATWGGRVLVVDAASGHVRWSRDLGAKVTSAPALSAGDLVIGDYSGRVWALSARTGGVRWVGSAPGRVYASPAVAGGRVFVTTSDGGALLALSARSGRRLWIHGLGGFGYAAPAVAGGRVVTGSYSGVLQTFSAGNGRLLWSASLGRPISGAPQVVNGVVWAASFSGITEARSLVGGALLQRFPHGEYVPLSGDARTLLLVGYSRIWGLRPEAHARPGRSRRAAGKGRSSKAGTA
jgi:outer membrane protein assembly factor BamB